MKRILFILLITLISTASSSSVNPKNGCLEMDILLLADMSGSVSGFEGFTVQAFNAFVDQFVLSENGIKIGVITFSDAPSILSPLTENKNQLKNKINSIKIRSATGNTNLYGALSLAKDEFTQNGRKGFRKVIIVISDGYPDDKDSTLELAKTLKDNNNYIICGILIREESSNIDYMKDLSSIYCYVQSNYQNLLLELKKLDICM